ncbi:MAG: T9SS type A sorting domain-containing protein, partial [candidate division WOR-3 bacterium]
DFATTGSIYIYQYEYEEEFTELASGPMAQESPTLNNNSITIFPNPFRERLIINLNTTMSLPSPYSSVRIYDVTGRLIRTYNNPTDQIIWDGRDGNDRKVSPGVYFLRFENINSEQSFCQKILKIE